MSNKQPAFARRAQMLVEGLAARAALIDERRKQRRAEHEADVDRRGVDAAIRLRRRRRKKEPAL